MFYVIRDGCKGTEKEHVCGRPLGLCFKQSNGDLYIADAYMGLLKVGPEGGLATTIATQAQGIPFTFCNSLDIDQSTGIVYFTDSSSVYQRRYVHTFHTRNSGLLVFLSTLFY